MTREDARLPIIDLDFAMQQTVGDREFLSELLGDMLQYEQSKIKELEEGYEKNDHKKLQDAAHFIKGAAANLGLFALNQVAKDLDALGKEFLSGKLERLPLRRQKIDQLKMEFRRLREYVAKNNL